MQNTHHTEAVMNRPECIHENGKELSRTRKNYPGSERTMKDGTTADQIDVDPKH
jgi:hypothetical protein